MGDGMTMQERASLDSHITGGGSPGIADEAENFGAPILLAWVMLDSDHAPMAPEVYEAIDLAIEEEGYKSPTAISLLKSYFKDAESPEPGQATAYKEFSRGWLAGVEMEALDPVNPSPERGTWEGEYFSYMLGHLSGDFAANLNWATPYEKDHDEADEVDG